MAVKQKNTQETPAVEAQSADTGNGGSSAKKERKPRTPRDWQWTPERQKALHRVLTAPKSDGTIRTAGAVAAALSKLPEFEGVNLTGALVASYINSIITRKENEATKKGTEAVIPAYLHLDSARVAPDLNLFS